MEAGESGGEREGLVIFSRPEPQYRCAAKIRKDLDGPISDDEAEERSALEARLWTAVDALPEMRRKCLLLAKRDGLSYKEIADELNISEHTVRNHISRALETLREGGQQMINFIFSFF